MTEQPIWVIELCAPQLPRPITVRIETRATVGRSVQGDPRRPDVDLEPFQAEDLGVSRQHFAFTAEADRLMVTDLGSHNGTTHNGVRLQANEAYRISHGDNLLLGHFRLDVKVVLSPMHGGDIHKQPSLQLHDQEQPGKGQLVLIVESAPQLAEALSSVLQEAGYTTRTSQEVVGAIRSYNQRRPSAVILDRTLPDMSGLELCRYIRRDVQQNSTPIVVIGAANAASDVNEALDSGADIYLDKPVSAKELRHVVSSLIIQHENGSAAMYTKHLVGTAPLKAMSPESRRNAAVLFVAGHSDLPITLSVTGPISFGRAASTGALRSHVDLSRYDAANTGVSRIHMMLHHKDDQFFIEDADSVNGTYLNGDPVKPRSLTPVRNADEIRLGQLRLYIYFLEDRDILMSDIEA